MFLEHQVFKWLQGNLPILWKGKGPNWRVVGLFMSKQIKVSIAGHLALDRGRDGMDSPEAPQSGTGTVDPHTAEAY